MGFFDKYQFVSVPRVRDYKREYAMRKAKALAKKQNEENSDYAKS